MLTAIMENRHTQRVIGSSSYRENYIWFNALILICCIRKYKAPFRLSADCSSLRGFTENNLIEMLESCFHEIWDAPVKHKEDQGRKKDRATSDGGVTSQRGSRGYEKKREVSGGPKRGIICSDQTAAQLELVLRFDWWLNYPILWDKSHHPFATAVTERL